MILKVNVLFAACHEHRIKEVNLIPGKYTRRQVIQLICMPGRIQGEGGGGGIGVEALGTLN